MLILLERMSRNNDLNAFSKMIVIQYFIALFSRFSPDSILAARYHHGHYSEPGLESCHNYASLIDNTNFHDLFCDVCILKF